MQPTEIEIEMIKSRLDSLEIQMKWFNSNWVDWTNSTKNMGQKIMIAFEQIMEKTHEEPRQ